MGIKQKIKSIIYRFIMMTEEEKLYPIPKPINAQKLLEGKVALITGGSGGIGLSIAESFLESGCKVIIAGTNEEKLKSCIKKLNGDVKYIVLNVVDDIELMNDRIDFAAALFAENRIDILVNSAGITSKNTFFEMTEKEYDSVMDTNAKGTYFVSQAVSKHMIKNKIKGHILNVSSSSALRPAQTPYQLSKWAIRGLTLGMADALLPYGIVVNAIVPGPVATAMMGKNDGDSISNPLQPSRRYALPSEIAAQAVLMVSDLGDLIVGDTIYMTGGSGVIDLKH